MKLILASSSPRRRNLLQNSAFDFEVMPVNVSETLNKNLNIEAQILDISERKMRAAVEAVKEFLKLPTSSDFPQEFLILTADTMVVLNGRALGKPESKSEAIQTLGELSGRKHQVITAISLTHWPTQKSVSDFERSDVTFKKLSQIEIETYVETGEPMDKAGSYGLQGEGKKFVSEITGPSDNVIGLPIDLLKNLIAQKFWISQK
jgi:septum formation protein